MIIEPYSPSPQLAPFIKKFLIIESQEALVNRVLPDTSVVIAFRLRGQVNYIENGDSNAVPVAAISGLRKSARLINYTSNTSTLLVIFSESGAAALIKKPLHELFEQSVPLDNFISVSNISLIEEQLAKCESHCQRISVIESFLLSELKHSSRDIVVNTALQYINQSGGTIKMRDLITKLCISQDAFEKRFRKVVGTSPKQFANIVRMRSLVIQPPLHNLTDLALSAGYYDQPHFNKDFKLFTGQTPTEFFRSPALW